MNNPSPTIFFITNDVERGLGLENILENFHIVCIDDNPIIDLIKIKGGKVFCLERELQKLNPIFRNSNKLLQQDIVQKYIAENTPKNEKPKVMFFKIAPNLERTCEELGYKILNTTSALNRKFENKISQYEVLKDSKVNFPKTKITTLGDANYEDLFEELGNFAVQYERGHTGSGTVFIKNKEDFEKEKAKFPKRTARISSLIEGSAWTLNACITRFGILYGGLSLQITGISKCTRKEGATVGNDWNFSEKLSNETKIEIERITKTVGEKMREDGFKGLFGLDFVIDKKGIVYLIEINARQPASTGIHTKLMVKQKQIPLQAFHIAEFLFENNEEYFQFLNQNFGQNLTDDTISAFINLQNKSAVTPTNAAQIIMRNTAKEKALINGSMQPGLYLFGGDLHSNKVLMGQKLDYKFYPINEDCDKSLVRTGDGYSIADLEGMEGFVLLIVSKGHFVNPEMEIARIQAPFSLLTEKGEVKTWVLETINCIRKNILKWECRNT